MNDTVFPDVTTKRDVWLESSIDVIGSVKDRFVVSLRVRRSHHLKSCQHCGMVGMQCGSLDLAIIACSGTGVVSNPDYTFDHSIMRQSVIIN